MSSAKKKILVVDDEEIMRSFLSDLLEDCGYDVVQASSGEEAIKLIAENKFDLVITDIRLQGKDGFDVLRELKALHNDIKVVLITGYSLNENESKFKEKGADGFLLKPFDINSIREVTKKLIGQ